MVPYLLLSLVAHRSKYLCSSEAGEDCQKPQVIAFFVMTLQLMMMEMCGESLGASHSPYFSNTSRDAEIVQGAVFPGIEETFNAKACFVSIKHIKHCYCCCDCVSP